MRHLLILAGGLLSPIAYAATNVVEVDHSIIGGKIAYTDAEPGDVIKVVVKNTCDEYKETAVGLEKYNKESAEKASIVAAEPSACTDAMIAALPTSKYCVSTTKTFLIPHEGEYSGYRVELSGPDLKKTVRVSRDAIEEKCESLTKNGSYDASKIGDYLSELPQAPISDASFVLVANDSPWQTNFSGGVAISEVTDPRYYIDAESRIAISRSAEDSQDLVFAAFAHVANRNCIVRGWSCNNVALTAGLGTDSGQTIDYFLGMSYRLGSAFVTLGGHWGQIDRLRSGVAVGDTVGGDSALTADVISDTNLSSRTDWSGFLSVSWTFGGDAKNAFSNGIANISQ